MDEKRRQELEDLQLLRRIFSTRRFEQKRDRDHMTVLIPELDQQIAVLAEAANTEKSAVKAR